MCPTGELEGLDVTISTFFFPSEGVDDGALLFVCGLSKQPCLIHCLGFFAVLRPRYASLPPHCNFYCAKGPTTSLVRTLEEGGQNSPSLCYVIERKSPKIRSVGFAVFSFFGFPVCRYVSQECACGLLPSQSAGWQRRTWKLGRS